jgi:hypothetical protein
VIVLVALDRLAVNALDLREHDLLRVGGTRDPQLAREHFERQTHFGAAIVQQRLQAILRQRILLRTCELCTGMGRDYLHCDLCSPDQPLQAHPCR